MEQSQSVPEGQPGAPPPWMRRATEPAPGRRARMLEHMARARSQPQPVAAPAGPEPSRKGAKDFLHDLLGYTVLFAIAALVFQSRFPLCLGAFFFFTDGELVEWVLRKSGIRFEPDAIGPDIVKCFVSWFGWGTLLGSWKSSAPAWLMSWMPPSASWSSIAATALLLAIVEAAAAMITRRAVPLAGLTTARDSLAWKTIQTLVGLVLLALLIVFDYFTSGITVWLGHL
jgi:hypothetical protein